MSKKTKKTRTSTFDVSSEFLLILWSCAALEGAGISSTMQWNVLRNFLKWIQINSHGFKRMRQVDTEHLGFRSSDWWLRRLISFQVEIVMSLLGLVCPPLFETIAELEKYHPRIALKWQLLRIFALFLGNLYTFLFALFDEVTAKVRQKCSHVLVTFAVLLWYSCCFTIVHWTGHTSMIKTFTGHHLAFAKFWADSQ